MKESVKGCQTAKYYFSSLNHALLDSPIQWNRVPISSPIRMAMSITLPAVCVESLFYREYTRVCPVYVTICEMYMPWKCCRVPLARRLLQ